MSNEIVEKTGRLAEGTTVDAVWTQWNALTKATTGLGEGQAWSIVDPEALVLTSLAMSAVERRLEDLTSAWAREAAFLMSKARFKTLPDHFPDPVRARLSDFARYAVEGGDSRWRAWISDEEATEVPVRKKALGPLRLFGGPDLVLRLRAGFGVNAKADLFALLLGLGGAAAGLKVIAAATAYSERMIRTATEEMVLAGFITEIQGRPSSFRVDPEPWAAALEIHRPELDDPRPAIPPWRFWAAVFAFTCDVSAWAEDAGNADWSTYVAGSKAIDLFERHRKRLRQAGLEHLPLDAPVRDSPIGAFHETVEVVCAWIREKL